MIFYYPDGNNSGGSPNNSSCLLFIPIIIEFLTMFSTSRSIYGFIVGHEMHSFPLNFIAFFYYIVLFYSIKFILTSLCPLFRALFSITGTNMGYIIGLVIIFIIGSLLLFIVSEYEKAIRRKDFPRRLRLILRPFEKILLMFGRMIAYISLIYLILYLALLASLLVIYYLIVIWALVQPDSRLKVFLGAG